MKRTDQTESIVQAFSNLMSIYTPIEDVINSQMEMTKQFLSLPQSNFKENKEHHKYKLGRQNYCLNNKAFKERFWVWEGEKWRAFVSERGTTFEVVPGLNLKELMKAWNDYYSRMTNFQAVYEGEFSSLEDVIEQFSGAPREFLESVEMIYACYDQGDYEGDAQVFFIKDGKLFEVESSHCSCDGLNWYDPEETSVNAILMRENISKDCRKALKERFGNVLAFE